MVQDSSEVTILAVNFSDELVEITFSETRNQSDKAALINQMLLQASDHREALHLILEELRDLVDAGYVLLRDPPQKMNPRDRMRDAADHHLEDDEPPVLELVEDLLSDDDDRDDSE